MAIKPINLNLTFAIAASVLSFFSLLQTDFAYSQEQPKQDVVQPSEKSAQNTALQAEDSPEKKKQKRLVEIGFLLLVGIGMLGGLLIVTTLILGFYSRRRVQAGKKGPTKFDPFWYLRNDPGVGDEADSGPSDDVSSESDHDE